MISFPSNSVYTLYRPVESSKEKKKSFKGGFFFGFFLFYVRYSTLLHLPPTDSPVSEGARIEPRTVATTTLAVRRSNHSARSHPEKKT
jgi:hypothetical protein